MLTGIPVGKENFDVIRRTGLYYVDKTELLYDLVGQTNNEGATKRLGDFLWDTISYNDYHEDYYHAFLAGLFVGLGYAVDSNKESVLGRFDVFVKDRRNRRAMIIEAKKSDTQKAMGRDCDQALRQIADRGYARRLEPGYEKCLCYGIAFFQKSVMIRKL